jgi:alpha-amylase
MNLSLTSALLPHTFCSCTWPVPAADCEVGTCAIPPNGTHQAIVDCKLIGLPDINQSIPYVSDTLLNWIDWIRDSYHIDGFRVDAAKHMPVVR